MNTSFLIDGFNFYHSIKHLEPQYHWINYNAFCKHFLRKGDTLDSITYFTSIAYWIENAEKRHRTFIDANELMGVKVVWGKFKEKSYSCPFCKKKFLMHEEKATDVNIALYAYRMASRGIEQIYLVTGDTDMVPCINLIKEDFPNVKVGVIFPLGRKNKELAHAACSYHKTTINCLNNCMLPFELTKGNGNKIYCPKEWLNNETK
ncbi:MAG: NYN domain-containing protein [Desulfovibrionaceae bacterium]|nr:NYN domain-containing protein [Desulfovibrionaceae bacterium]